MTDNWFIKNKKSDQIVGPYSEKVITEYIAHKKIGTMHQLSADKELWIDCLKWNTKKVVFENYDIVRELGRGGMGIVYLARDKKLERDCALKVLVSQQSQIALQRFSNEAKSVAKLDHPYIIKIYEVHTSPKFFLVMEYVDGLSFRKVLKGNKYDLKQKLQIFSRICEAVAYAHGKNILHRDLKPENIIISKDLKPVILDFGIAKNTECSDNLTKTNEIIGTPHYVCPEMILGQKIDKRSDIYSLGVILYEILTGHTPFIANNIVNLVHLITSKKITPPSDFNAEVKKDSHLEVICLKALAISSDERISSASFLQSEIDCVLLNKPIQLKPPTPVEKIKGWCMQNLLIFTSLLFLFAVLITATGILFQAKELAEKKMQQARKQTVNAHKEIVLSKKNLIDNILQIIRVQKDSSDIFSHYLQIEKCFKEWKNIQEIDKKSEIVDTKKIYSTIKDHLKFLILPRFPHTKTKDLESSGSIPVVSLSGKYVAQVYNNGDLCFWETNKLSKFTRDNANITLASSTNEKLWFSSNDAYVMYKTNRGDACIFDLKKRNSIFTKKNGNLWFCRFTLDNRYAFIAYGITRLKFMVFDLHKRAIYDEFSFYGLDHIAIAKNSQKILFHRNNIDGYFTLYDIKTKTQEKIYHKLATEYSLFFNHEGNTVFLFNLFGMVVYDINNKNSEYYASAYTKPKISPVSIDATKFIFNDRQYGLVLTEKQENNFTYKEFKKYGDEEISSFAFAPNNFIALVQNRKLEIRDLFTKEVITSIQHENSIHSMQLRASKNSINIDICTQKKYKNYQIKFSKLGLTPDLTKLIQMQKKLAAKALFEAKVFTGKNTILYASAHGFVSWHKGNLHSWNSYKLAYGFVSDFAFNPRSNQLYVVHQREKILVYDIFKNTIEEHSLGPKFGKIIKVMFTSDGKMLYIVAEGSTVFRHELETQKPPQRIMQSFHMRAIAKTKTGEIILGDSLGRIAVLNEDLNSTVLKNKVKHASISTISLCDQRKLFVVADKAGLVSVWQNFQKPTWIRNIDIFRVNNISFSPCADYMAVFTESNVFIYNIDSLIDKKKAIYKFEMYAGYYKSGKAFFDKDWNKAYFPDGEGNMLIFDQSYLLNKKIFHQEIIRCDNVIKNQNKNFYSLGIWPK